MSGLTFFSSRVFDYTFKFLAKGIFVSAEYVFIKDVGVTGATPAFSVGFGNVRFVVAVS